MSFKKFKEKISNKEGKVFPLIEKIMQFLHKGEFPLLIEKIMQFLQFSKIDGDYLEFGVYGGKTFKLVYKKAKVFGFNNMKFYAFDSFEGLPEQEGEFNKTDYSFGLEEFKKELTKSGVNLKDVVIIGGWYNKTLNEKLRKELEIKKAALIMVDCDIYKSAKDVLKFITPYIQDGTIMIFDDWYCIKGNPEHGEHKAFFEWLKVNPQFSAQEYHKYGFAGNSFIINIKENKKTSAYRK